MDFGNGKIRMNVEEDDRLSSLPDELIHVILSFVSLKQAIQTTVLSSRWRFLWTSMPDLTFSKDRTLRDFPKFLSNVLSFRDNQTQLSSVKLVSLEREDSIRILSYALSKNVQQLTVSLRFYSGFPFSILDSQSLKHLNLIGSWYNATPTWNLPALTTLHLENVTLSYNHDDDLIALFLNCTNLKNLSIKGFRQMGTSTIVFNLFHPQLSNLKLTYTDPNLVVNVIAPQLKNLIVIDCYREHMISAPGLTSFVMKGDSLMQIFTEELCYLEKLDFCIFGNRMTDVHKIVSMLQQCQNLKFVTLNLELLEALSSSMELIPHQLSVKILKFSMNFPIRVSMEMRRTEEKVTELKNYDTSPLVSREEIRVMKNIVLAQKIVAELWVSNKGIGEKMREMNPREIEGLVRMLPPSGINSWLQQIEGMLAQLPASKRAAMQPPFSKLCEDAAIVMNNMLYYN